MEINQLNHVALHVADVDKSVRFYQEVLGLELMDRPAFDFPGAWFAIGPAQAEQELHLIGRPAPKEGGEFTIPSERHFAMRVTDIDAADAKLKSLGIEYRPPRARPDGAMQIYLRDPDGHVIELCQPPSGNP